MDFHKEFAIDKEAAEKGRWFPLAEDGKVKVCRLNNPAFKAECVRLQKPHLHILRSKSAEKEALLDDITRKAMAKTILVDFEGIVLNGEPIPYSPENAYYLFVKYPDFQEKISQLATGDNFRPEDLEEIAGK